MPSFNSLTDISHASKFVLPKGNYDPGNPILQCCVVNAEGLVIHLTPLKQGKQVQETQKVAVSPLLINRINKVGTIIFFENAVAVRYHTAATLNPESILKHYT